MLCSVISYGQFKTDSLSAARYGIPIAALKNYIVMGSSAGNAWDIFSTGNLQRSSGIFSISRTDIKFTQAGNNAYYAGGKYGYFADPQYTRNIDVFNASTGGWSLLKLSLQRIVGGAGTVGNNVFFAGGIGRQDISGPVYLYNRVDIFNTQTNTRTTASLSKARDNIAVGAAGGKIVFAGGWFWDMSYNQIQSNVADIYDNNTGSWSKALLSARREGIGVATLGNKIIFAGGSSYITSTKLYKNVDIYDAATNTWSVTYMNYGRANMGVAVAGNKAFFAGGGGPDNIVDVYDASTNTWSTITMPVTLKGFSVCAGNDKIYFSGGYDAGNHVSSLVQIYTVSTNTWSSLNLSQARYNISSTGANGYIIFAGGLTDPLNLLPASNRIDIYKEPAMSSAIQSKSITENKKWMVYPNPALNFINITSPCINNGNASLTIYNMSGEAVLTQKIIGLPVNISQLAEGVYILKIDEGNKTEIQRLVVMK